MVGLHYFVYPQNHRLRPRKPAPTAGLFHISRYFRSLRGRQILVRGQLLHLAAFRRVKPLLDFFAWSERCAHLVCASNQERRGGKQGVNERLPDWSDDVHLASMVTPGRGLHSITSSARARSAGGRTRRTWPSKTLKIKPQRSMRSWRSDALSAISFKSPRLFAACQPPASLCSGEGRVFQLFSSCVELMSEALKFFPGKMIKAIASRRAATSCERPEIDRRGHSRFSYFFSSKAQPCSLTPYHIHPVVRWYRLRSLSCARRVLEPWKAVTM